MTIRSHFDGAIDRLAPIIVAIIGVALALAIGAVFVFALNNHVQESRNGQLSATIVQQNKEITGLLKQHPTYDCPVLPPIPSAP